jgi:isocitrate/isopropylmalate dehydrogenase
LKIKDSHDILAGKMILDWLGETELGAKIEAATAEVIAEGKIRTYDMGGSATTLEIAQAIAEKL